MIIADIDIDKLKLRPNHVLLYWRERLPEKDGLIVPEIWRRKSCMAGDILAKGKCQAFPELEIGQTVIFNSLCDKEFLGVRTGERRHIIIRAEEIIAVVDSKNGENQIQ